MSSNDHSAQNCLNLPADQVENNFDPMRNPNNNDNNNINYLSNPCNIVPQNTFEFYLPLPNDTVYRVIYTQVHSFEIATLLNNSVDISNIPDSHFPHHQNIQSLIRQQIYQRTQQTQHIYQPQQQSRTYETMPNSQVYSNNNTYNNLIPSNEDTTEDTRYTHTTNQ
jgi:hypothetical protein